LLIQDVGELSVRTEKQFAWRRSRLYLHGGRSRRTQLAGLSVERKLHPLVRGGNADEGELARPVKRYRGRARHSYNLCRIAKLAIPGDRQHGHTSLAAIGDPKIPRLPIERQVTR